MDEIVAHDQHVRYVDRAGQHDGQGRVEQAQVADIQVFGNHAAGKEHGEGDEEGQRLLSLQVGQGKRVGRHGGKHHVDDRAKEGIDDGVFVAGQYILAGENALVRIQGEILGEQPYIAAEDAFGRGEGSADGINERIQGTNTDECSEKINDTLKCGILIIFFHACYLTTNWFLSASWTGRSRS